MAQTAESDLRVGHDALHGAAGLLDRSSRGQIEVAGTEAVIFLHNLCTNDVKSLAPGAGCEAYWCSATARVIAHGFIWRGADDGKRQTLWLDLPPALTGKLHQHLDRYLISEDVTLTDQSTARAQWHLAGPAAAGVLTAAGLSAGPALSWHNVEGVTVRSIDGLGVPGFDLLCPVADAAALRQRLVDAGARVVSAEAAEVVRVETGTPEFGVDLDENTFAPEVNRTARAISYTKGCYLGQEPIVMARDRGVVQRLLVRLTFEGEAAPPGSLLFRDGKEVGRVTSSVISPVRGPVGLGYVRRGSHAAGTALEAHTPHGARPVQVAGAAPA